MIKDIDGNDVDDLVILENTKISVYTFDQSVNLIGAHDFLQNSSIDKEMISEPKALSERNSDIDFESLK